MTLRQLEILQAIVKHGGFTAAARELRLAQPSISQQVQLLEQELGQPLFNRFRNRRTQLTDAGKLLWAHAEAILRQCQVAQMEVSGLLRDPSGQVSLGLGQNQLSLVMPRVLQKFREKYPRICVDLVHANSPALIEMLKTNRLDLGVISLSGLEGDLRLQPLFTEEMVVVVRKSAAWSRKTVLKPSEIAALPLILYDETMSVGQQIEQYFRAAKITPKVILRLNSAGTLKLMIEENLGATIVPSSDLLWGPRQGALHAIRLRGAPLKRTVAVAIPPATRLPHVAEALLKLLFEESRGMPLPHGTHH